MPCCWSPRSARTPPTLTDGLPRSSSRRCPRQERQHHTAHPVLPGGALLHAALAAATCEIQPAQTGPHGCDARIGEANAATATIRASQRQRCQAVHAVDPYADREHHRSWTRTRQHCLHELPRTQAAHDQLFPVIGDGTAGPAGHGRRRQEADGPPDAPDQLQAATRACTRDRHGRTVALADPPGGSVGAGPVRLPRAGGGQT